MINPDHSSFQKEAPQNVELLGVAADTNVEDEEKNLQEFAYDVLSLSDLTKADEIHKQLVTLRETIKSIDRHEDFPEEERLNRRTIYYDEQLGKLFVIENGQQKPITIGDIAGDAEWSIRYRPDDAMDNNIWARIRKVSALVETRKDLADNLDVRQDLKIVKRPDALKRLEAIHQLKDTYAARGVIAEVIARSFLLRLQHNDRFLGFRVRQSTSYEDDILKYDLKIVQGKKSIGLQLTVTEKRHGRRKHRQLVTEGQQSLQEQVDSIKQVIQHPADEIVLVILPKLDYTGYFNQWLDAGKPSGGPEQFMNAEEMQLFESALMRTLARSAPNSQNGQ
ncbi:MAG: hypothetical protein A3A80_01105 [Candidatus Terrybacteria bacterium RIFCSPLOWO2_01_FULL_44_24]|nr:MAG: hypothetical protein A3B75_02725 [Candidatus Terrybacteria bacterium RIFCSPHIGHO2_02_FULL_43_14]OHA50660.1 MAG: hypothetical protein A3A80_01105 [Candidatus Terrybacteria bacterium RIFCSPLOWO2_01_FULL_44_24]